MPYIWKKWSDAIFTSGLQIYTGTLFEQADLARDFVLARINRAVGLRTDSFTASATFELPPDAVGEAIVNATAHRDYSSNASVEVRLFADRLEVWNPGRLPGTLTIDDLRADHHSVPNNPHIAESLYLARYIEKAGSGTQMMIELCRETGLPEPDFRQTRGAFVITPWRDWLTENLIKSLGLNDRQQKAMKMIREQRRVTNIQYQETTGVSRATAKRDLESLVSKGILTLVGAGRGAYYQVPKKRLINGSNGSFGGEGGNGS